MTLVCIVDRLAALAVSALYRLMQRAPTTRYRGQVADDMEKLLLDLDRARGVTPPVPRRTRALLLLVKRPVDPGADQNAVVAYVRAVVLGAPATDLAERVQATGCPELMRRLIRLLPVADLTGVKRMLTVAEVMTP
jgi:hypothetical protein